MKDFQSMVEETKVLVQKEIENKGHRPDYILEKQLYFILDELDKMGRIRNIHMFHPYYPKGIADTWDYSNPLTIRLLELLDSYRKL